MKNRFLCLIYVIILYLVALPVYSQAVWKQYDGPFAGDINSLARYGDTLFIGSRLTGIFKSHDGGKNWTHAIPSITYTGSLLVSDDALLIGTDRLLSYTDSTHDPVPVSQVVGAIDHMHKMNGKLFVSNDQSVYKYDPETHLLVEKNNGLPQFENGVRWTRDLTSIDGILFCNVLADGLYKSMDEGESWEKVEAPNFNYSYLALQTHNDSLVYVGEWHVFLSTDKGQTLNDITYNLPSGVYLGTAIIGNQIFVTTNRGFFRLNKGSTLWVAVGYQTTFWAIMLDGKTMYTSDEGGLYKWESNKFILCNKGINTSSVRDIEVFNHKLYSGTQAGLFFTKQGSDNWQAVPELHNYFAMTLGKNESTLFAGTNHGLYAATITDPVFQRLDGIPDIGVWDIEVLNDRIFVATDNGVYVSYNEGATWKFLSNTASSVSWKMFVSANDSMLLAGNSEGLFRILPDSSDWEKVEFFTKQISSINLINGIIYASQMNSGIYRSADYGDTWVQCNMDAPNDLDMIKRGNNIYAASYNKVYHSSNNGLSWDHFYETGIPDVSISCIAQGAGAFYIGTRGKSIWYRHFLAQNDIASDVYTIANDTIYNINSDISLAEFQEQVSVSYGASIEFEIIHESDTSDYTGLNRVKIIAEDGTNRRVLSVAGAPGGPMVEPEPVDPDLEPVEPDVVTGVNETEKLNVEIYPIPTSDKLFIKHAELLTSCQIINSMGQKQPQQELLNDCIDVTYLPKGIYFLVGKDKAGKTQTIKFLKN